VTISGKTELKRKLYIFSDTRMAMDGSVSQSTISILDEISQQLLDRKAMELGIDVHGFQMIYCNDTVDRLTFPPAPL